MIEESQSLYYLFYALLCGATGIAYLKIRSTEGSVITTNEFKRFQSGFLTGYSLVILCELIAAASFFHTFLHLKLSLEQITKLYLTTVCSTTVTGIVMEIVDLGTRKDKCALSAGLYSLSMFSIFFGGHKHMEMLMIGRIVYGTASALHHSSFENYAINGHTSLGFPEDWLVQTFSFLTHAMAFMAAVSGALGQVTDTVAGEMGCAGLCSALFALATLYIILMWEKDSNVPKFMLHSFTSNLSQSVSAIRSNKQMLLLVVITSLCETSITIFTFYWAPWMQILASEEDHHLPYEIIFSSFIVASMLGNYLFQVYSTSPGASVETAFQAILIASSVSFFLGASNSTSTMAFVVSIFVQICMGSYYPCIGYFRGRIIMPELRNTSLVIARSITLALTATVLHTIHHSPMLMLATCASLNGSAAYLQITYMDSKSSLDDDEESDEENDSD
jgi:hypothetical protein